MAETPNLALPLNLFGHIPMQRSVRVAFGIIDAAIAVLQENAAIDAIAAAGSITFAGVGTEDEVVVIGDTTYRLRNTLAQAYDVKIGASAAATATALFKAINASGVAGTDYFADTLVHPDVVATNPSSGVVLVTALVAGDDGNTIVATSDSTDGVWDNVTFIAETLTGGADADDFEDVITSIHSRLADLEGVKIPAFSAANEGEALKIVGGVPAWAVDEIA